MAMLWLPVFIITEYQVSVAWLAAMVAVPVILMITVMCMMVAERLRWV